MTLVKSIRFHGAGRSESESAVSFVVTGLVDRLLCGFRGGRNQASRFATRVHTRFSAPPATGRARRGEVSLRPRRSACAATADAQHGGRAQHGG